MHATHPDPPAGSKSVTQLPYQIGQYTLTREVGRGGMGTVYEATQEGLDRPVAIKLCTAPWLDDKRHQRFVREANTSSALEHPNIVAAFDFGYDERGVPWLAMPLVDGTSLDVVEHQCPFSWELLKTIGCEIASALQHAHSAGVIHRDVKPGNIIINRKGKAWITDFGIASIADVDLAITQTGEMLGSPKYMAPEQLAGHADERSDIYGLGVSLYSFALSHKFDSEEVNELIAEGVVAGFPPLSSLFPDVPRALGDAISRAVHRNPQERQQSALAFKNDLETPANGNGFWLGITSIVALGAVAVGGLLAWHAAPASKSSHALVAANAQQDYGYDVKLIEKEIWLLDDGTARMKEKIELAFRGHYSYFNLHFRSKTIDNVSVRDSVIGQYAQRPTEEPGTFSLQNLPDNKQKICCWFSATDESRCFEFDFILVDEVERFDEIALWQYSVVGGKWNLPIEEIAFKLHPPSRAAAHEVHAWINGESSAAKVSHNGDVSTPVMRLPTGETLEGCFVFPASLFPNVAKANYAMSLANVEADMGRIRELPQIELPLNSNPTRLSMTESTRPIARINRKDDGTKWRFTSSANSVELDTGNLLRFREPPDFETQSEIEIRVVEKYPDPNAPVDEQVIVVAFEEDEE